MKYTPETGFLLDLSPEIGLIQETRFLCTSLTWKVLYLSLRAPRSNRKLLGLLRRARNDRAQVKIKKL